MVEPRSKSRAKPTKPTKDTVWDEFECPECTAHNPYGDGFTFQDELFCSWCGVVYLVKRHREDDGPDTYRLVRD